MVLRRAFLAGLCLVVGCDRSNNAERQDEVTTLDCTLSIRPPGATVILSRDGRVVGRHETGDEPLALELEPGTYTVEAMKDGYEPFIRRVTFGEGATTFTAKLSPILTELVVRSDPGVAIEAVDDQGRTVPLGRTDSDGVRYITTLVEGRYTIRLSRPNHQSVTRTLELKSGQTVELRVTHVTGFECDQTVEGVVSDRAVAQPSGQRPAHDLPGPMARPGVCRRGGTGAAGVAVDGLVVASGRRDCRTKRRGDGHGRRPPRRLL